jgi:hydrogenase/urease accessory protein HupE
MIRAKVIVGVFIGGVLMLLATSVSAHEVRPAYLEVNEIKTGQFELFWKVPQRGDMRLHIIPVMPGACRDVIPAQQFVLSDAAVERRTVDCGKDGFINKSIVFEGLEATITDVLVRVSLLDSTVTTTLVRSNKPWMEIRGAQSVMEVASEYIVLGIGHILSGIDHLLFVLGLLLLVRSFSLLIKTITAFTVAHSITLAMATLGFVNVPQTPVEATIALSILFLARELGKQNRGEVGLMARYPWIVSFSFGLLHGFGFAGALAHVGLPKNDIPLALFTFNVGVEAGQLLFVATVLAMSALLKRLPLARPAWVQQSPTYVIGSLAAFWFIQRVAGFWL